MSTFNIVTASVAVTDHARKGVRLESSYDGLAAHYGLTSESDSATITDAARSIVIMGGANDGTVNGSTLTDGMLKGRNPGDGPVLPYWKAARAVRIGLVSAIKRANPDTDDDDDADESEEAPKNLLTRAGLAATLEEVTAAWVAAQV